VSSSHRLSGFLLSCFLIASVVTAVMAVRRAVNRARAARQLEPVPLVTGLVAGPDEAIRAEAQVFRTTPGMLALDPGARRERRAHPRDFKTYRFLRSYPGAPPRIPHALMPEEFQTAGCKTCHQRGGYSLRFAAYVPVTPHPERGICLQCHVGEDSLMGIRVSGDEPNARCPQCHGRGGPPNKEASLTWATSVWPQLPKPTPDQRPPAIPHGLLFRENCVTCHSGPAAVEEIRTTHAEQANCRQCHLAPDPEAEPFTRPGADVAAQGGTTP